MRGQGSTLKMGMPVFPSPTLAKLTSSVMWWEQDLPWHVLHCSSPLIPSPPSPPSAASFLQTSRPSSLLTGSGWSLYWPLLYQGFPACLGGTDWGFLGAECFLTTTLTGCSHPRPYLPSSSESPASSLYILEPWTLLLPAPFGRFFPQQAHANFLDPGSRTSSTSPAAWGDPLTTSGSLRPAYTCLGNRSASSRSVENISSLEDSSSRDGLRTLSRSWVECMER